MKLFAHVSAELTEDLVSLLPFDTCAANSPVTSKTGSCTVNQRKALYLQSQLTDHDVVVCSQLDVLKLSGTWETLVAVHCWLEKLCEKLKENRVNSNDICISSCTENNLSKPAEIQQTWKQRHTAQPTSQPSYAANEGTGKTSFTKNADKHSKAGSSNENYQNKLLQRLSPLMNKVQSKQKQCVSIVADKITNEENEQCPSYSTELTEQHSVLKQSPESQMVAKDVVRENTSQSQMEFRCDSCDYVASVERNLSYHKLRVHGIKTHKCNVCRSSYALLKDLRQHLKVHSENYCCEHCGRKLKSRYALMLHIGRIHNNTAPRTVKHYLCTLCGKMCRSKTDYTAHRNKQHLGIRPFCCGVCGAEFYARSNLRAHEPIHSEKRMFQCKHCNKSFKQRQGLRIHVAGVHSTVRPYQCQQCTKSFSQRTTLDRHVLTHTRTRPFACTHCSSMFNDCSVLRRHLVGIHKLTDPAELRQMIKESRARARLSEPLSGANKVMPVLPSENDMGNFDNSQYNTETTLQPSVGEIVPLQTDAIGSTSLSGEVVNFGLNDVSAVFGSPTVPYSNLLLGLLTKPNDTVDFMQLVDPLYVLPVDCSIGAGGILDQANQSAIGVVSSNSSCGDLTDTNTCTLSQYMLISGDNWKTINDN